MENTLKKYWNRIAAIFILNSYVVYGYVVSLIITFLVFWAKISIYF